MTQNQKPKARGNGESTDPPEGLEIIELIDNQKFRIRELVSWQTKGVGSVFLAIGILVLMMPITRGEMIENFLDGNFGTTSMIASQVVRALLIATVICLLFQIMRLLFGKTEVYGTTNTFFTCRKLFGIPWTCSMRKSECQVVVLQYSRAMGRGSAGERLPGNWKLSMIGRSGSLTFYRTASMEQAKWLSRFVATWYGVKFEQKGDKRRFGW